MKPRRPSAHRRPGLGAGLLLALALVWLQTLGLTHRVAHAPPAFAAPLGVVGHVQHDHGPDEAGHDHHHAHEHGHAGGWQAWFGHDEVGEDCRLFDQLALADLAPGALATRVDLSGVQDAGPAPATPRAAAARRAQQARAPPSIA